MGCGIAQLPHADAMVGQIASGRKPAASLALPDETQFCSNSSCVAQGGTGNWYLLASLESLA